MTALSARLAEIEARAAAATEGPCGVAFGFTLPNQHQVLEVALRENPAHPDT